MSVKKQAGVSMLEYIIALAILSATFLVISSLFEDKAIEHAEYGQTSGADMIHCGTRPDGSVAPFGQSGESCL